MFLSFRRKATAAWVVMALGFFFTGQAQPWMSSFENDPKPNFFQIQQAFNDYWAGKTIERGKGYKPFKRWEWFWEPRVNPDGSFPDRDIAQREWQRWLDTHASGQQRSPSTWTSLGPNSSLGGYAGIGRINCIAFHPTDSNTYWMGAPGGGIWKTTDGGSTWTNNTDNLPVIGVSSIVVEPTDPNIIYIATGDGNASDTYSVGVLKSTDGGVTWASTGLSWLTSQNRIIRKLQRSTNDPNVLLAATSIGMYRTTNAGATWTLTFPGNFYDAEAKPGDPQVYHAATSDKIYRSLDGGQTWSLQKHVVGSGRIALGVSPANPNFVVALCGNGSNGGCFAVFASTDGGQTYAARSGDSPNLLGWSETGSDVGGQAWYDLCIAVDPTNADVIYTGGVNTWKSTDGGFTWSLNTHWYDIPNMATAHADKHALEFQPGTNKLFQGNDGGIYIANADASAWTDLSNGIAISQIYRLATAQTSDALIAGLQDNGTKTRSSGGVWDDEIGGDGMDCAINPTDANVMYGELYFGGIHRSTDGGVNWVDIHANIPGQPQGNWVTPFILDPVTPTTIYAGFNQLWKSTDQGDSWTAITPPGLFGGSRLSIVAAAPSDPANLIVSNGQSIWGSTDGGATWNVVAAGGTDGRITDIEFHPTNPSTFWMTRSNYVAGQKVFKTTDGGSTWTNVSGTLPNLPANCIIYQPGSPDGLYIGMDVGVFYTDNSLGDWEAFNQGLPNSTVTDLEIRTATGKLRAATYGRGAWESDLFVADPLTVNINPPFLTVPPTAGSAAFSITSNTSWTLACSEPTWTITGNAGSSGNDVFNVNYSSNPSASPRAVTITATASNGTTSIAIITQTGAPEPSCTNSEEPANNTVGTAPVMPLNRDKSTMLGSGTDVDIYKLNLTNDLSSLTLTLDNLPEDYDLELLDEFGDVIGASGAGSTTPEKIVRSLPNGTYYARVYSFYGTFSPNQCYTLRAVSQAPVLTVGPATQTVQSHYGSAFIQITSNTEWTAYSDDYWASPAASDGTGSTTLEWFFEENFDGATRTATIHVDGGGFSRIVKIKQPTTNVCTDGNEPANNLIATAPTIPVGTEKRSILATATDVDLWKFTITGVKPTPILANLSALPNDYDLFILDASGTEVASSKEGAFVPETILATLAPGDYYARVAGFNGAFEENNCYALSVKKLTATLAIGPGTWTVRHLGGVVDYLVTSNVAWSVTENDSWLTSVTPTGNGTGLYSANFLTNPTGLKRTANLSIAGGGLTRSFKLVQLDDPALNPFNGDDSQTLAEPITAEDRTGTDADGFEIFPNPTSGMVTLLLPDDNPTDVELVDATGRRVLRTSGSAGIDMDLSGLPNGFYWLKIQHGGTSAVKSLVLLRD
ncbi:MAG: T9SS type A sorting domain-containing protein [Saprospiraceae bacterium]